ncbi:ATP-binding cassette domain-containing protein [Metallosphaera hakonensis]|uniref:ATP-binding cassette domain-containing protein n=1 Tax=Metallosphaera hakonensis TaxID=79601 RepID=UPI0020932FD0|nr:ATP-binding cassette domain-containing protein [Metallosphaera hakonensis]
MCVTGPNGSGKSTLLNIIAGFIRQDQGSIVISGKDVSFLPPERRGIVIITQDSFIPSLTVDSHLMFGVKLSKTKVDSNELDRLKALFSINFTGKMKNLSLGQRERVAILTALLRKPRLILIDEATANISDKETFIKTLTEERRNYGFDLIFTTQDVNDSAFADHHYVMNNGLLMKRF